MWLEMTFDNYKSPSRAKGKAMKQAFFAIICAVLLAACGTRSDSLTVRTPNGERTVTVNEGEYSRDRSETIDSTRAYRDCLAQSNAHRDPSAEAYCRRVTSTGPVGGSYGGTYGYGVGPGMNSGMGIGYDPSPIILMMDGSTPATRAMERATGQSVVVNVPVTTSGPGTGAPAQGDDYGLIVKALKEQQDQICKLREKQGQSCSQ